ncbi:Acetyl-Coa Carboxylase 2 [Manis pentadactyla]|nr:Acetyl-Coa Carboxylase 2 [Manis pentadactyla]
MKPGPLTAAQASLQPRGYRRRGAGRAWGVVAKAETRLASATAQARRPLPPRGPAPYRAGYLARTPLRDPRSSAEKTAGTAGTDCSGGDVATRGEGRCALIPGKQAVRAASVPEDRTSSSAGQRRRSSRKLNFRTRRTNSDRKLENWASGGSNARRLRFVPLHLSNYGRGHATTPGWGVARKGARGPCSSEELAGPTPHLEPPALTFQVWTLPGAKSTNAILLL